MHGQITAKNLMTGQVFITFRVTKLKIFIRQLTFFTFFYQILHICLVKIAENLMNGHNLPSRDLMPRQKLTPEIPKAQARTSVPTLIRESPPPPSLDESFTFKKYCAFIVKQL